MKGTTSPHNLTASSPRPLTKCPSPGAQLAILQSVKLEASPSSPAAHPFKQDSIPISALDPQCSSVIDQVIASLPPDQAEGPTAAKPLDPQGPSHLWGPLPGLWDYHRLPVSEGEAWPVPR